jgi:hypothetical protein
VLFIGCGMMQKFVAEEKITWLIKENKFELFYLFNTKNAVSEKKPRFYFL